MADLTRNDIKRIQRDGIIGLGCDGFTVVKTLDTLCDLALQALSTTREEIRYERRPELDKRIARGDDYAGDAYVRWVAVGNHPNDRAAHSARAGALEEVVALIETAFEQSWVVQDLIDRIRALPRAEAEHAVPQGTMRWDIGGGERPPSAPATGAVSGYVSVPREPTDAMVMAGDSCCPITGTNGIRWAWKMMLAASPSEGGRES